MTLGERLTELVKAHRHKASAEAMYNDAMITSDPPDELLIRQNEEAIEMDTRHYRDVAEIRQRHAIEILKTKPEVKP